MASLQHNSARRQWFSQAGRIAVGAAWWAAGCAVTAPAAVGDPAGAQDPPTQDPPTQGRPKRVTDPAAAVLIQPVVWGGALDGNWRLLGIELCPDQHWTVRLADTAHGGEIELELFRGPSATRPLAHSRDWELYSYNGGRGGLRSPEHVLDAANQIALLLADNEGKPEVRALHDRTASFAQRQPGA
jgi:hypothetical protein